MSRTFFISDTHFNHKMLIDNKLRPFSSTQEMDNILIKNWNETVSKDDVVWFLGDWGFGGRDVLKRIIPRLKGHIKMIMGNHDTRSPQFYIDCGIEYVSRYPIVLKRKFILSHAPINCEGTNFFNIYGHVHLDVDPNEDPEHSRCVCVEQTDYKPIRLDIYDKYVAEYKKY